MSPANPFPGKQIALPTDGTARPGLAGNPSLSHKEYTMQAFAVRPRKRAAESSAPRSASGIYPRLLILLICLFAFGVGCLEAQSKSYADWWTRIDSLQREGLPQSALEALDSLYAEALADGQTGQQIKALMAMLGNIGSYQEAHRLQAIARTRQHLQNSTQPATSILHSILAQLYWNYYTGNRGRFAKRGALLDYQPEDIATWDLQTLSREVFREFHLSLEQRELLQELKIEDFSAMLQGGDAVGRGLRPTLYDFLAHRALDFFKSSESGIALPPESFQISDLRFFAPAESFARWQISSPDTLSLPYNAALLFQDLLLFHLDDADPAALLEVDIERLEFFYQNTVLPSPEQPYAEALRLLQSRYAGDPLSALPTFKLARLKHDLGIPHDPDGNDGLRWNYKQAAQMADACAEEFPTSFGGQSCAVLAANIRQPRISVAMEEYACPGQPWLLKVDAKNLNGIRVKVFRQPYPEPKEWHRRRNNRIYEALSRLRKAEDMTPVLEREFRLENEGDYRQRGFELPMDGLPAGHYLVWVTNLASGNLKEGQWGAAGYISVSDLAGIFPASHGGRMLLLSRSSGERVGAQVQVLHAVRDSNREYSYERIWRGCPDSLGLVTIPKQSQYYDSYLLATHGADSLMAGYLNQSERSNKSPKRQRTLLFADRAIYRPGQTVHLKGVSFLSDGGSDTSLCTGWVMNIVFQDANGKTIYRQNVQTNEFGTFSTSFTIPKGLLNGEFSIRLGDGILRISVEEYKRPRFEVKLDKPEGSYKLNQTVSLKGRALTYTGFPVDNAVVSFRVSRQAKYPFWRRWWGPAPQSQQQEISFGKVRTDSQGGFTLSFLAEGDASALPRYNPYFNFVISADVTDISGETHSAVLNLAIGEKDLILDATLPEQVDLRGDSLKLPVKASNLGGEPLTASGEARIVRLRAPGRILKSRLWSAPDRQFMSRERQLELFPELPFGNEDEIETWPEEEEVWKLSFALPGEAELLIDKLSQWKPGAYKLELSGRHHQQEAATVSYFTLFDSRSKRLPYPQADWFVPLKVECQPGETARLLIGSSYARQSVLYEVEKNHSVVLRQRLLLDGEQRLLELPVTEADRGGFWVHLTFFRAGRVYLHSQEIKVPWTNKELSFEYASFRDKLLPGGTEEWRLKVKDHSGGAVLAEVLASMYDASLDAFRKSDWNSSVYGSTGRSHNWLSEGFNSSNRLLPRSYLPDRDYPIRRFERLDWQNYYFEISDNLDAYSFIPFDDELKSSGVVVVAENESAGSSRPVVMDKLSESGVSDISGIVSLQSGAGSGAAAELESVHARANFAETAFFYPDLRTDADGGVYFSFQVPESLTRWKFRALASTTALQLGYTEREAVTQKPLMVQPNLPRFLREGDRITLSAKISSLDDGAHSGYCQLFLFDALSMQPVDSLFALAQARQPFSVAKGTSAALTWELNVPFGLSAVTCRFVAASGDFSDGEENTLPILSNRMLVTESLPLAVRGRSEKAFDFTRLREYGSDTLRHYKLTLEYSSNPAWYAIQALPYLMEDPYPCNEVIFARFYANSLAAHIAQSDPRIERVFKAWRDSPSSTALLSKLEQNEELKSLLLQETPWVMDAQNETEAKHRLGLLFDLNHMAGQSNSALAILARNQLPGGGWSWFNGMGPSWWTTQYIVEGFGHLDHLGVGSARSAEVQRICDAALGYLDGKIRDSYLSLKKRGLLNLDNLGYLELHYLYTRSFFLHKPVAEDAREAVDYFLGQARKYWRQRDFYSMGLIALSLHRRGDRKIPPRILASLREHSLHDEELGTWWRGAEGWFWYQAPIGRQALLIEAFSEIGSDTALVDEMRTWLLKMKQTTHWKTTVATAQACYALLLQGTEWLAGSELAQITLGGESLEPASSGSVEAGTGYFKTSWTASEIEPRLAQISVSNPNPVPSWGALHWQYWEDLDKITGAATPLSLNKKLFREIDSDRGKVLEQIGEGARLKVGDKLVVRIELRSDRDMEYVHLKDMRGAGFEPINVLSRYKWQDGLGYYEATGDAATNFFIDYLRKGTYVFEYPLRVSQAGEFSNGIASIQCMYAPEFNSHSEGIRVLVQP